MKLLTCLLLVIVNYYINNIKYKIHYIKLIITITTLYTYFICFHAFLLYIFYIKINMSKNRIYYKITILYLYLKSAL